MAENTERTFIMIKPDGVQRGIVGDILRRFEQRGYKLVALKMIQVSINKTYIGKKHFFLIIGTTSFA
jgi:nucleoside-diphosphate kinase